MSTEVANQKPENSKTLTITPAALNNNNNNNTVLSLSLSKNGNTFILQMASGQVPTDGGGRHRRRTAGRHQAEPKRQGIRQPLPRHERHHPSLLPPRRPAASQKLRRHFRRRLQLHRPRLLHRQAPQTPLPSNRSPLTTQPPYYN